MSPFSVCRVFLERAELPVLVDPELVSMLKVFRPNISERTSHIKQDRSSLFFFFSDEDIQYILSF